MKILLTENKTASVEATGVSVPGNHKIVGSFPGDSNNKPSVSQPIEPCAVTPAPCN